jgi:two-component system chemotaxis response regulator CheY
MPRTVLIVDDSKIVLEINRFAISSAGYEIHTALGGLEALEIMTQNAIDLAIIDINMPGMDGYTLTRKIRADKVFGDVPIIIITTETEAQDKRKGFEAGANVYLIKPIQPDEMIAQIKLLIGDPGNS